MRIFVLVGAIMLGGVGFASAAAVVKPIHEAPLPFNWSGAYAGAHLGYGWGKSDFVDSEYNGFPPIYPVVNWRVHSEGFLRGIQAGYNWQHSRVVFGMEGEISYLNLKGEKLQPGTDPYGTPYDASGTVDGGWYGGISARLGYALNRTLFYSKAGAVYSGAKFGFLDTCTTAPCGNGTINASEKIEWGYQLGAGMEHTVTDNWAIKAEYTYFDFENSTITGTGVGGGSNGITYHIGANLSAHTLKAGLNYKF